MNDNNITRLFHDFLKSNKIDRSKCSVQVLSSMFVFTHFALLEDNPDVYYTVKLYLDSLVGYVKNPSTVDQFNISKRNMLILLSHSDNLLDKYDIFEEFILDKLRNNKFINHVKKIKINEINEIAPIIELSLIIKTTETNETIDSLQNSLKTFFENYSISNWKISSTLSLFNNYPDNFLIYNSTYKKDIFCMLHVFNIIADSNYDKQDPFAEDSERIIKQIIKECLQPKCDDIKLELYIDDLSKNYHCLDLSKVHNLINFIKNL